MDGTFVGVVLFTGMREKVAFQGFCTAQEDSRGSEVGQGGASISLRISVFVQVFG